MEAQIRESLSKLERLSDLIPQEDPRTAKARLDFQELNQKFGDLVFEVSRENAHEDDAGESGKLEDA